VDEQGEEVGIGEVFADGLAVASFEGVEDAGQAQLLESGVELGDRVHGVNSSNKVMCSQVNR
jgi:hypothetical protein